MGRETDFLDLYRDLGLHPDCGLPEFRQAYRRRLSVLHPDRPVDGQFAPPEQLQRLTALYGAAMEFHRQHGRLPGAIQPRSSQAGPTRPPVFIPAESMSRGFPRWWLLLPLVAFATWMLWPAERSSVPTDSEQAYGATNSSADLGGSGAGAVLQLGMNPDTVRAIEGEPVVVDDDRWDYGPSWVRFENQRLAGWYSSPMHPLKIAASSRQP